MNSQITYSQDITPSLIYGQNPAKGGEILMCSGVILHHTPKAAGRGLGENIKARPEAQTLQHSHLIQ